MNDMQMLNGFLGILALLLALNFKLTYRLYRKVKHLPGFVFLPDALEDGAILPELYGKNIQTGEAELVWRQGFATALIMFASRCPKCKSKLAEVETLLSSSNITDLDIKLVTNESVRHFRRFLNAEYLLKCTVRVSQTVYLQLNPQQVSPSYLFIGHEGNVEASGIIGDENWKLFCGQVV